MSPVKLTFRDVLLTCAIIGVVLIAWHVGNNGHAIRKLESHNHDGRYLSKSAERDIKELIERRLSWLRHDLEFDIESGLKLDTKDVMAALLERLHLKIEYMPWEKEEPKIIFHYHFPEIKEVSK